MCKFVDFFLVDLLVRFSLINESGGCERKDKSGTGALDGNVTK